MGVLDLNFEPPVWSIITSVEITETVLAPHIGGHAFWGAASVGTKIYFAPRNAEVVAILDTACSPACWSTRSTAIVGRRDQNHKYGGIQVIAAPPGGTAPTTLFFSPYHEHSVGVLDTATEIFTYIGTCEGQGDEQAETCISGKTGKFSSIMNSPTYVEAVQTIYFAPRDRAHVGVCKALLSDGES